MASANCEWLSGDESHECMICMEAFVDPCALRCSHTFCRHCLVEYVQSSSLCHADQEQKDLVRCPACRQISPIPSDLNPTGLQPSVQNLYQYTAQPYDLTTHQPHLTIDGIVHEAALEAATSRSQSNSVQCNFCGIVVVENHVNENGSEAAASATSELTWCIDCCQHLCSQCIAIHSRKTTTASHRVVPLTTCLHSAADKLLCSTHNNCITDLFCWRCQQLVCSICRTCEHVDHSCDDVSLSAAQLRSLLLNDAKSVAQHRHRSSQLEVNVSDNKTCLLDSVQAADDKIRATNEILRRLVDQHCSSLRDQLTSIKQLKLKQIQAQADDLQQDRTRLDSLMKKIESLVDVPSDVRILLDAGFLHESVDRCLAGLTSYSSLGARQTVTFTAANWTADSSVVGRIEVDGGEITSANESKQTEAMQRLKLTSTRKSKVTRERPDEKPALYNHLMTTWSKRHTPVAGLALLANSLYVCHSQSSHLDVYDRTRYRYQRSIDVPELTEPTDIAAAGSGSVGEIAGRLFVSSEADGHVFRITLMTLDSSNAVHERWTTDDKPYSVSVNAHLLLLVLSRQAAAISMYDYELRQLRRLRLPASVSSPWSAIQLPPANDEIDRGDFIVCHSDSAADAGGRVRRVISRLDGSSGAVHRRLDWLQMPTVTVRDGASVMHMVAEQLDSGGFLLADQQCDSVIRVNTSLTSHQALLSTSAPALHRDDSSEAAVDQPRRLCVDPERQRLLVGLDDGGVKVFSNSCVVM